MCVDLRKEIKVYDKRGFREDWKELVEEAMRTGFFFLFVCYFVVRMGIIPMEKNSGRFPRGKPAATESRYPTLING